MNMNDFLSETSAKMADDYVSYLNGKKPEELENITRLFSNLTELAIHMVNTSPEFRKQFARVHAEFFKYPESSQVFDAGKKALQEYESNKGIH